MLRTAKTSELDAETLERLRRLNEDAHGHPFVEDWEHALGGTHFIIEHDGELLSHGSVVERILETRGVQLRTGYVEAVATAPAAQRHGLASRIMQAVTKHVVAEYDFGALSTGQRNFYERFGWERWLGPTNVRTEQGLQRTADEDGGILFLRTPRTPRLDLNEPISCDWRAGDVW